jgi:hypothetical protein
MKKTLIVLALVLAACGTTEVTEGVAAPAAPAPAPAPKPEPVKEPYAYGDDAELDALWDGCADGVEPDCDDLYWLSPAGSEYEDYALDRVNELAGIAPLTDQDITDAFGTTFFMDLVWSEMSADEQAELCLGVRIFGPDGAAAIIVAEATTFDAREVAEWLSKTCP